MPTVAAPVLRPGPRPSTSREEIVRGALRMLDREGPEGLSFRAVARELGMTVGALSRYFRNLADLEDEVAAEIMSELRPLQRGRGGLRQELLRMSLEMLQITRAHPYLAKIHGPASAAVIARHTRECLHVMLEAGIGFDRALAIYALLGSLPSGWIQENLQRAPERDAEVLRSYNREMSEFAPQMARLAGDAAVTRRWLALYIDALLAAAPAGRGSR